MDDDLAAFPYVNGGLFSDENIIIPRLNEEIVSLILHKASENFNWSEICPTIFGAVFESTLNPETRRSGGMHYTSIENIHKVINPLFLDGLKAELEEIGKIPVERTRRQKLEAFQQKLALTDNGPEFLHEDTLEALLRVPIYYCHPYCAWEKGSVERHNRLLRVKCDPTGHLDKIDKSKP